MLESVTINWLGFFWGLMAALSYTATMYSSNNIELDSTPLKRSLFMILGGFIIIALIFHSSVNNHFSTGVFMSWGIVLSLFGTILPPLLFTRGMPLTGKGMGLGAIIASVEIPVSIFVAFIWLKEPVNFLQWIGVILILFTVVLMNLRKN
ncbi:DMT family transporter [Flavobacterium sp. CSZ]|uniref:EamA family transporter n=1 Tax=Flavobacterium sp. CSZ TaxID=2783791 RepID=UPI001E2A6E83|nr:DMT family transporter [Flavobacterium sp. CSZ]